MSTYDAFELHRYQPGIFGVTLVNRRTGERFVTNQVACPRQAVAGVTLHGKRKMAYLGCTEMRAGHKVPLDVDVDCAITDPLHVHTHRFELPPKEGS